ncbi:glycoside hydrolase family 99-like domain-containing protein [Mesorhizobium mediterraneum]|uniref:glycoside hydrolase family 99-like domain-containing protein n=1 Tax=Mesorhizobium TaxID=68287 RepID=UPI00197DE5AD|nr:MULTISPECIES: glycoside hydrolase family 99-like domain-containing protein [Mesorhizobium]WIW52977.1 glycoside hydrolase family 99-like domain-containing protein [Mesorhizobium mediterraneum]
MNKQPSPENLRSATPAPRAADKAAAKARAKAKPTAAKRTCIMVLGMHRSGTSALTRAISLLGAGLPKNMLGANPTNETGHWEPLRLMELHDRMLAEAGSRWDDWRAFDLSDLSKARARLYRAEIARLIDEEYGNAPLLVLKEPRISRFVPLYADVLKSMKIDQRYVLASRNPLAVIASLGKRGGSTLGFGALLWLRHELEAECSTRGAPRVFVSYEGMVQNWRLALEKIGTALDLVWPRPIEEAAAEVDAHISTDHQHHVASDGMLLADERIGNWVKDAYSALKALEIHANDATAMAILDRIKAEFDAVAPVFGDAFFPELDARLQVLNRENTAQRQLIEQREDEIARLTSEQRQKDSEVQVLAAQLTEERADFLRLTEESNYLTRELQKNQNLVFDLNYQIQNFKTEKLALEIRSNGELSSSAHEAGNHSASFEAFSKIPEEQETVNIEEDDSKLIAFYLPQFHRIDENSEWWGPGFTEWTNVARATPNFVGHNQPKIPRDLGYYDLTHPNTMREQVEIAKLYGLHGFCFYHYWFSGRRVLETPANLFLESDLDFKFCMCWANENWTRAWDGDTKNVLLEQKYAEGDAEAFIDGMLAYFGDQRYIKIDGAPLLVVYRAKEIPNPQRWFSIWRDRVTAHGFPGLHICVVDFYDISAPEEVGADSLVEFPPHKFNGPQNHPSEFPAITNPNFSGGIVDYRKMIAQSANRLRPSFKMFRAIIPGWDNTARRQNNPTIIVNSTPKLFGEWLRFLRFQARQDHAEPDNRLIFVNAWNEWGEGCYLEPDQQWGLSYLEETLRGKFFHPASEPVGIDAARSRLFDRLVAMTNHGEISSTPIPKEIFLNIRPPGRIAERASAVLRQSPTLHAMARYLYRRLRQKGRGYSG